MKVKKSSKADAGISVDIMPTDPVALKEWQIRMKQKQEELFARLKELEIDAGYQGFHEDFVAALKIYDELKTVVEQSKAVLKTQAERATKENWPIPEAVITPPREDIDYEATCAKLKAESLLDEEDYEWEEEINWKETYNEFLLSNPDFKPKMDRYAVRKTVSGSVRLK